MARSKRPLFHWFAKSETATNEPIAKKKKTNPLPPLKLVSTHGVRKHAIDELTDNEVRDICNYTNLIDVQLRIVFQKMKREDLAEPDGFTDCEQASPQVKEFLECRKVLERFIADDILYRPGKTSLINLDFTDEAINLDFTDHDENPTSEDHSSTPSPKSREAQLRTYAQWVEVANQLRRNHNYEGFALVMFRLAQIDVSLGLSSKAEFSPEIQKKLELFEELIEVTSNFKNLRKDVNAHRESRDLLPTFLMTKDMMNINASISQNKQRERDAERTIDDLKNKSRTPEENKDLRKQRHSQKVAQHLKPRMLAKKTKLLDRFEKCKQFELALPEEQQRFYVELNAHYQLHCVQGKEDLPPRKQRQRSKSADSNLPKPSNESLQLRQRSKSEELPRKAAKLKTTPVISHARNTHSLFGKSSMEYEKVMRELFNTLSPIVTPGPMHY